jgi:AraC family transcriptional regulator
MELMEAGHSRGLNLDALAPESGYSRSHFLRMFRAATGQVSFVALERRGR